MTDRLFIENLLVNALCCLIHFNFLLMLACTPTLHVHRRASRDINRLVRDAWHLSWLRLQPPAVIEERIYDGDIELLALPRPPTDNQAVNDSTPPPAPTRRPPTPPVTRRSSTRPVSAPTRGQTSHSKLQIPRRFRRTASKRIGFERKRLSVIHEIPEKEPSSPKAREPSPLQEKAPTPRRFTIAGYPERSNADFSYFAAGCSVVPVYRAGTPPSRRPPAPFESGL